MRWLLLYTMAALADSVCNDALLASLCVRNPTSTSCRVCISRHQHDLRLAGCTATDVSLYCDGDGSAVFGWNATAMAQTRERVQDGTLSSAQQQALGYLIRSATAALSLPPRHGSLHCGGECSCAKSGPWSVVDKSFIPPSGNTHQFVVYDTYAWPCNAECNTSLWGTTQCKDWWKRPAWAKGPWPPPGCNRQTGLPWITHDGFGSSIGQHDSGCGYLMADTLETLAQAYYFTGNVSYGVAAAKILRVWFIEPATRMSPSPGPIAIVPGDNETHLGIIFTTDRWNSRVTDSAALLTCDRSQPLPGWGAPEIEAFAEWNSEYVEWLMTSADGVAEARSENNHATLLFAQKLALVLSAGEQTLAERIADDVRTPHIAGSLQEQIEVDGEQKQESAREAGAEYSVMNLKGLFNLARLCSHTRSGEGIFWWKASDTSRGSVRAALDYLLQYATNASKPWPHNQDGKTDWHDFPWLELAPMMRQAAVVYREPRYEEMIERLPWRDGDWPHNWYINPAQLLIPFEPTYGRHKSS